MAKSHASQRNRSDGAKRHALKGDRPENRPENLIFYLVTSILLHSVLFVGSNYWLRAFAPKQELSEPIPIEFVEVPPNQTKTPPETSQRAAKNSVAGGKPKPEKPISAAQSASTTAPKGSSASKSSEVFLPDRTQQKTVSSNSSAQKLQPKPQKIAIAPVTKPLAEPSPTAVTPTKPPEPEPSPTAVAPTTKPLALKLRQRTVTPTSQPPEPEPSPTAVAPTTKPLALKLRQRTVTPTPQPPEPEPSPTAVAPTTKPLALKLRQRTVTPTSQPPEPEPSPTAIAPTTKPLALKLRQRTVTPTPQPPEPEPSPTAIAPTAKPLALKLRQRTVTPTPQPPEPEPSPTAIAPTTKPLALKLRQRTVTPTSQPPEPEPSPTAIAPTTKPLALKPRQTVVTPDTTLPVPQPSPTAVAPKPKLPKPQPSPTAIAPTTKPLALKPRQTVVTPDTTLPVPLTRRENRSRLAAKSSPEQLENRTNSPVTQGTRRTAPSRSQSQPTTSSRKLSRVQQSSKSGGASSLGGSISVSSRDFGSNNLAALPNSNRFNRATQGIDARQDADIGAYLQQLQEQVRKHWIPGFTQSSQRTVLHFTVSRAGLVSNLQVAQTSGFSATDEAAVSAVKRAVPFAPLPTVYTENYINIQFTFNINVYGQLELWSDQ